MGKGKINDLGVFEPRKSKDGLTDRLGIGEHTIAPLSDIIAERAALATGY